MNIVLLFKLLLALSLGVCGALLASKIRLPSAFFLGPVLLIGFVQIFFGSIIERPEWVRFLIQISVGIVIGSNFIKVSLENMKQLIRPAFTASIFMVGGGLLIGLIISRLVGIDLITALIGAAPGGQGEMVLLAEEIEAQTEKVIVLQLVRNQFALIILLPLARVLIIKHKLKESLRREQS